MKNKKLLILALGALLFVAGCKKNNPTQDNNTGTTGTTGTTGSTGSTGTTSTSTYAVTETFESGSKTAYADANVALNTGSWDFNDALIGNLATDVKDGTWS